MDWKAFLTEVSRSLMKSEDLQQEYLDSSADWLGFPGATDEEINIQEARLGVQLPPSYKEFLMVSNGFKQLSCFIWDILPVASIQWLKDFDPYFYNLYNQQYRDIFTVSDEEYFVYGGQQSSVHFRSEYLCHSIAVSGWGDSAFLLLNPNVKFGDEWEAWMYANWHPGATRYKSFEDLMTDEFRTYLEIR